MVQSSLPFSACFRKGQTLGSLQHAPQLTHCPLRLSETGRSDVKVLPILADQVFLFFLVIAAKTHI